ncbi:MAG TPA: DUF2726 domain-containing protein [Candidatus Limnocylindria bacterium]|jgi:hypothetical protein
MALAADDPDFFPYKLIGSLLSPTERAFFTALQLAAGKRYLVFPKVRLLDLCMGLDAWSDAVAFNHVSRKHVDFVLCDAQTLKPVLAVELDDRSHRSERARYRDSVKDQVLAALGLGIYRQWVRRSYDPAAIARGIEDAITP